MNWRTERRIIEKKGTRRSMFCVQRRPLLFNIPIFFWHTEVFYDAELDMSFWASFSKKQDAMEYLRVAEKLDN